MKHKAIIITIIINNNDGRNENKDGDDKRDVGWIE